MSLSLVDEVTVEEVHVPSSLEEVEGWLMDTLATNIHGLTPSQFIHKFYMQYQQPLNVPIPPFIDDDALPSQEVLAEDRDHFIHSHRTPTRDPLKATLARLPGVTYEKSTNKFILGDQHSLLRIRMRMAVEQVANGIPPTYAHWQMLFRKLDRDGSGKLDRREFYSFVREHMKLPPEDYSDAMIWEVFNRLDTAHNSLIPIGELVDFAKGH